MRRFNKLEEAILKMVKKSNTTGVTWDEYGNPIPLTGETDNTPDKWCHYSGMPSPNAYVKDKDDEQAITEYNKMEEESEMENYNEMRDEQ